eukprot:TRINITY_DN595_c0_g1_i6.p1 TRINITY_DN595_c0_g1~~TRINITY_DN595_c0_g1_i6.p1  ORF type:complete len:124 (-),score=8.85 TRINITY_DN595_c0_g1_i6:121-492(-)
MMSCTPTPTTVAVEFQSSICRGRVQGLLPSLMMSTTFPLLSPVPSTSRVEFYVEGDYDVGGLHHYYSLMMSCTPTPTTVAVEFQSSICRGRVQGLLPLPTFPLLSPVPSTSRVEFHMLRAITM